MGEQQHEIAHGVFWGEKARAVGLLLLDLGFVKGQRSWNNRPSTRTTMAPMDRAISPTKP